jgi:photosystem II stability/assembly factor-like uncharacterized protein
MNKLKYICAVLLIPFYINVNAQWVQTASPDGNYSYITSIVANEGNLFASTWGNGVYKSTDGGASWVAVNNGIAGTNWFYTGYVYELAVVPSTSGSGTNLFAGMEEGGIWRSSDDGASWDWVYPGGVMGEHDINMVTLGVVGNTVLAGAAQEVDRDGVYRSTNDGVTWTRCNGGFKSAADSSVRCFASIKVGSTTYTYAGTDGGVFISTNDGASWTRISNGLPAGEVEKLVATRGIDGVSINIFAGIANFGIYRSTNNGTSWTEANNGLLVEGQTPYVSALVASPVPDGTMSNIFATFRMNVFVSTDNGTTWKDTGWPNVGGNNSLVINGGMLYGGSYYSNQIWKYSLVADSSWVVQQSGIKDSLYTVKAVNNNVVWTGGTNGTVLRTTNGGTTWNSVGGGTIGSDVVNAVEALDANTALIASYSLLGGKIFRTTNGGSSWSSVFNHTGAFIGGIQMKNSLEGYAVGSPVGGKWLLLKTTNGGNSWDSLKTAPVQLMDDYGPTCVQLHGDTLWFGTYSGSVYRSTNLGATWTSYATSGSISYGPHFNSSIEGLLAFNDGSSNKSTDGGTSWNPAQGKVSRAFTCISGIGNEYWATTGGSIAYTKNMGQSWSFSAPGHGGLIPLNAVSISPVASPVNGWAVGESGLILHYQRGGTTPLSINTQTLATKPGLEQIYPNPFTSNTTIKYKITEPDFVSLKVFDAMGIEVANLVNEQKPAGDYSIEWNAAGLQSGIYFCRMHNGSHTEVRKMYLLK